jgi:hypothetical protein
MQTIVGIEMYVIPGATKCCGNFEGVYLFPRTSSGFEENTFSIIHSISEKEAKTVFENCCILGYKPEELEEYKGDKSKALLKGMFSSSFTEEHLLWAVWEIPGEKNTAYYQRARKFSKGIVREDVEFNYWEWSAVPGRTEYNAGPMRQIRDRILERVGEQLGGIPYSDKTKDVLGL